MKRMNIVVDEELLEKTRAAMGERTYSGAISKALDEAFNRRSARNALRDLQADAAKGDFFDRDYVEEMFPDAARRIWPKKVSAAEHRAPRKGKKR